MSDILHLHYIVDGEDFTRAGEASANVKKTLRQIGVSPEALRRIAIVLYEGEINMVIHADGGVIDVDVAPNEVVMVLKDTGKGIANIELAMKEGYSTAPEEVRSLGFGAGMGLSNMKKYSDEMEIESTVNVGTTVTMKVSLS